jgi:hypothetical protein
VLQNLAGSEKSPQRFRRILKNSEKIIANRENSAEMQLKRNRKILEIQNSVELTKLSAKFADNSAIEYRTV